MNPRRKERIQTAYQKWERFSHRVNGLTKLMQPDCDLTNRERLELESLLKNLTEQRDEALKHLEELRAELDWRVQLEKQIGFGIYRMAYSINADSDGWYHYRVTEGQIRRDPFDHVYIIKEATGKFRTRRVAVSRGVTAFNKAVASHGKNLKSL